MKSGVFDLIPSRLRRSLEKLGRDISLARRKRGLTIAMMAERIGVARGTYLRVEKGDATVAIGTYAMALFVLGLGSPFEDVADARHDEHGLMLDAERVPKRVRVSRKVRAL
jgi:DNA-binding XRE family transcriptional regulator